MAGLTALLASDIDGPRRMHHALSLGWQIRSSLGLHTVDFDRTCVVHNCQLSPDHFFLPGLGLIYSALRSCSLSMITQSCLPMLCFDDFICLPEDHPTCRPCLRGAGDWARSQQAVACGLGRSCNCLHTAWINTETRAGTKPQLESSEQAYPFRRIREAFLALIQSWSCPDCSVLPRT